MSTNCIHCGINERTDSDLLCDDCRGCQCQQCERYYRMDLLIPDDLWLKISPTKTSGGLLCPHCIITELGKLDWFSAYHLTREQKEV